MASYSTQVESRIRINTVCLFLLCCWVVLSLPVRADDYMDALRLEAGNQEYLDETQPNNAITAKKEADSPEIKNAIQSMAHFEDYYRQHDSASAAIYFRLNNKERRRIYRRFKSTRDLEVARKMTIEIFNKKQKTIHR